MGTWALGLGAALVAAVGLVLAGGGRPTVPEQAGVPLAQASPLPSPAPWASAADPSTPTEGAAEPEPQPERGDRSAGGAAELTAQGVAKVDWWAVLGELDRRRAQVLTSADPARITSYAVPGSPAHESDERTLADLAARGVRPEGLSSRVLAIEHVVLSGGGVEVQMVDLRSGYRLVDVRSGEVTGRVEPAGATRWMLTVRPAREPVDGDEAEDPGWRVQSVRLSD